VDKREEYVEVPRRVLLELAKVALKLLEQLDEASRIRWEANSVRQQLEHLLARVDPAVVTDAKLERDLEIEGRSAIDKETPVQSPSQAHIKALRDQVVRAENLKKKP